jgi:DNA-binding response OmpR family regulator
MAKSALVVEDDQDLRASMLVILQSLGFSQIGFESAKDALAYLQENTVDIALVDVVMPEMNGFELLEHLKSQSGLCKIPVILVTAKDNDNDVLSGYQHGADYYITKPFTKEQLRYGIDLCL